MNKGKYGLCLVRSGCMVRSYFQGKPVCGRLNVGCAGSGPGGYGPLCAWSWSIVPGMVLFPWYSGLCLCLVLVRAKPLSGYMVLVPGIALCFIWNRVRLFWGFRRVKGEGGYKGIR